MYTYITCNNNLFLITYFSMHVCMYVHMYVFANLPIHVFIHLFTYWFTFSHFYIFNSLILQFILPISFWFTPCILHLFSLASFWFTFQILFSPSFFFTNLSSIHYSFQFLVFLFSLTQYWLKKREKMSKPLCRRYWPHTSSQDTNPYNVFRYNYKVLSWFLRILLEIVLLKSIIDIN